jgi:UDP-N-acetylmuramoyl-L-alanyl-D-glutamate--2,6-diaminopimelate ligase
LNSKKLIDIVPSDPRIKIIGNPEVMISGLTQDSRKAEKGCAFIAIKGIQVDGHDFINKAIENGANAIFCHELPMVIHPDTTYILWLDPQKNLAELATSFYDDPSRSMKIVGVTGTNGKSTVVVLLYQLFTELGYKAGLISTIRYCFGSYKEDSSHTTPDVLKLNELLSRMRDAGCSYVFMEVSSHGIAQGRVDGLHFDIGIFTNL